MPQRFVYLSFEELGTCPAAVNMIDGTIEINKDVWSWYTEFEQKFIIEHEKGHYNLQTDSEEQADAYALRQVYGTAPKSLKKSIDTLYKVGIRDDSRLKSLYIEALKIDTDKNENKKAFEELTEITKGIMKQKSNLGYPFLTKPNNKMTGGKIRNNKNQLRQKRRYVNESGKTDTQLPATPPTKGTTHKSHKTNGVAIGGMYFSFTNVLLFLILVFLFMLNKKIS